MDESIDLLALARARGWSETRITALRNTCAAAAGKETLPESERALARAVADALSGQSSGISREHMAVLERAELFPA
jgi:hypothetical protein